MLRRWFFVFCFGLPLDCLPLDFQLSIGGFCITAALAVSSSAPGSPWPVGWQSNWDWRGPWKLSSPTPSLKQGQLWNQHRLLRALSGQVLKTFKDESCTICLGNLIHCFIVPVVKKCLLIPARAAVNCLALSFWHPPCMTLLGTPKAITPPGRTSSAPSVSPHRANTLAPAILVASQ